MKRSTKIILVTAAAEVAIIASGLALAATLGWGAYKDHGNLTLAASAMAFPMLLAVMELFKIPAGVSLYRSNWMIKPFALVLLMGGTAATFETVSSAGLTWFRSIQHEVTSEQTNLRTMEEKLAVGNDSYDELIENRTDQIAELDKQITIAQQGNPVLVGAKTRLENTEADLLDAKNARLNARNRIAAEYDETQSILTEREQNGGSDAAEAAKARRALPARPDYIEAQLIDWDAANLAETQAAIIKLAAQRDAILEEVAQLEERFGEKQNAKVEKLLIKRDELQVQLDEAVDAKAQAVESEIDLKNSIEQQKLLISKLAGESIIYDIAAKVYAKPATTVSEEEANEVTAYVVFGTALIVALATGVSAFVATHLDSDPSRHSFGAVLRRYLVTRRWRRKQTVTKEVVKHQDRIVYRYMPHPEAVGKPQGWWGDMKKGDRDAA